MCIRDRLEEAGNGKDGVAHADFRYTVRAAVCFGAVSYTHLDVYKRQLLPWASWRRSMVLYSVRTGLK